MKVTFPSLLFLVLLILKLTGYIAWSWVWITVPLWGIFAIVLVFTVLAAFIALCVAAAK